MLAHRQKHWRCYSSKPMRLQDPILPQNFSSSLISRGKARCSEPVVLHDAWVQISRMTMKQSAMQVGTLLTILGGMQIKGDCYKRWRDISNQGKLRNLIREDPRSLHLPRSMHHSRPFRLALTILTYNECG